MNMKTFFCSTVIILTDRLRLLCILAFACGVSHILLFLSNLYSTFQCFLLNSMYSHFLQIWQGGTRLVSDMATSCLRSPFPWHQASVSVNNKKLLFSSRISLKIPKTQKMMENLWFALYNEMNMKFSIGCYYRIYDK